MRKIRVKIVRGNEGYSLQLVDRNGTGTRYAGPKAWGNPTNIPLCEWEFDVEDFIKNIKENSFLEKEGE